MLLAFAIGIVAGLRSMTAPAAASWAAHLGAVDLDGSWLAFLAQPWAPWILTVLALAELVVDKLPRTPRRTKPGGFGARIVTGAVSGAALAAAATIGGAVAGILGAVLGTLGGYACRARLTVAWNRDLPAALVEDAVAIAAAAAIVLALP